MSSSDSGPLICVAGGGFGYISCFDGSHSLLTLTEYAQIPTSAALNYRVVSVPAMGDSPSSSSLLHLAVSQAQTHFPSARPPRSFVRLVTCEVYDGKVLGRKEVICEGEHRACVLGLAASYPASCFESSRVISGDEYSNLNVVDASSGRLTCELPNAFRVLSMHTNPKWPDEVFVSGGNLGFLYQYDLQRGTKVAEFVGHPKYVGGVSADASKNLILSTCWSNQFRAWSKESRECVFTSTMKHCYGSVATLPEKHLILLARVSAVDVLDSRMMGKGVTREIPFVPEKRATIKDLARVDAATFVVVSKSSWASKGTDVVAVFDPASGKVIKSNQSLKNPLHGVCCSPSFFDRLFELRFRTIEELNERVDFLFSDGVGTLFGDSAFAVLRFEDNATIKIPPGILRALLVDL